MKGLKIRGQSEKQIAVQQIETQAGLEKKSERESRAA